MSVIKNSIWNLFGYAIPTLVAIPALGFLARDLGPERFGIYTIAIAVIGYSGIFDVGLTRSIIREVALYRDNSLERMKIISTGTSFLIVFSLLGAFALYYYAGDLVLFLKISGSGINDVKDAFKLLAFCIPLFILNQLWVSILEGDEKFGIVNIQKSISSSCIAGFPAIFVWNTPTLSSAILGIIIARLLSIVISAFYVRSDIIKAGLTFDYPTFKRLIFFGGWMTVSNIISPIMVYFDRFIVSSLLGAQKVAFYSAPSEAILRLGIIPAAVGRAIFPRLSNLKNVDEFKVNVRKATILMAAICLPVVILGCILSSFGLKVWLGAVYALHSSHILNILLIGFLFNALAMVPFSAIQAMGKSKVTALLHCSELIPYLIILYFLVNNFGLTGAAIAWSIRVIVDSILLFFLYNKFCSRLKFKDNFSNV